MREEEGGKGGYILVLSNWVPRLLSDLSAKCYISTALGGARKWGSKTILKQYYGVNYSTGHLFWVS